MHVLAGENGYHSCPLVTSHKRAEHTAKHVYKFEKVFRWNLLKIFISQVYLCRMFKYTRYLIAMQYFVGSIAVIYEWLVAL